MAATEIALQAAILLLTLAMFTAIQYFPKQALNRLRTKNRTAIQSNHHFVQGTQLLSRAKSKSQNRSESQTLAKNALSEAEIAISLSPRDPAPLILRALALDLLGHKASAIKSLDHALSSPRVKSLERKERGDALVKRAELKMSVNRRHRVGSAIEDLNDAVRLNGGSEKVFCLLGQCNEWKGNKDGAKWAYEQALKAHPECSLARDGLGRLGL